MKMGSLFSGIGGLELGLERSIPGLQTVWQVEKEEFCRSVLERHWPNTKRYNNVHHVGAHNLEPVDVICAGFPCQSISIAGHMKGLEDEEKSGLWWHVHRLVSEFQSIGHEPILVLENVANIIRVGGPDVVGSLTQIGYDIEWTIISAAQCGAPHLRRRWFAVAYPSTIGYYMRNERAFANTMSQGLQKQPTHTKPSHGKTQSMPKHSSRGDASTDTNSATTTKPRKKGEGYTTCKTESTSLHKKNRKWKEDKQSENLYNIGCNHSQESTADTNYLPSIQTNKTTKPIREIGYSWEVSTCSDRRDASTDTNNQHIQKQPIDTESVGTERLSECGSSQDVGVDQRTSNQWHSFPTQSPVCRRDDGVPNRVDRLKALGNAVVPQCAEWVGQQIVKSGLLEVACLQQN